MTIFTIDSENNIAAHGSASEVTDKACQQSPAKRNLRNWLPIGPVAAWSISGTEFQVCLQSSGSQTAP